MQFEKREWALIIFNLIYILGFSAYYIGEKNYEFLWYVAVLVFFFALVLATLHRSKFDGVILWGLSLWGLLHMAGGGVPVGESVLYALPLIPIATVGDTFILKYDQFVHFFGFAVATLVVFHLLRPYLNHCVHWGVVYAIVIAAGAGLGALNEIVEFTAVLVFSETGVGGYYNTALDLVFNVLGAFAAVAIIHLRTRRQGAYKTNPAPTGTLRR